MKKSKPHSSKLYHQYIADRKIYVDWKPAQGVDKLAKALNEIAKYQREQEGQLEGFEKIHNQLYLREIPVSASHEYEWDEIMKTYNPARDLLHPWTIDETSRVMYWLCDDKDGEYKYKCISHQVYKNLNKSGSLFDL